MKRILFVDQKNTCRSRMAEAWFNLFAEGWGKASSCGMMAGLAADPLTLRVMQEAGLELRNAVPKPISNKLLIEANVIVAMGKDVSLAALPADYVWDFQDPTGKDAVHYRIQRDAIRSQVQELIVELQRLYFTESKDDWLRPALLKREMFTQQMLGL